MEIILARKISELNHLELTQLLTKLMIQDREAFLALKELVDDL